MEDCDVCGDVGVDLPVCSNLYCHLSALCGNCSKPCNICWETFCLECIKDEHGACETCSLKWEKERSDGDQHQHCEIQQPDASAARPAAGERDQRPEEENI